MSEWVSVEERLPRYGQEVWVCTTAGVVQHVAYFLDASDVEDAAWWESCADDERLLGVRAFSHWMPLPEPPR